MDNQDHRDVRERIISLSYLDPNNSMKIGSDIVKTNMSLVVGINGDNSSFWKERDNMYIGYVPVPGVSTVNVTQQGRVLTISGANIALGVSYSYNVTLHTDSVDNPIVREDHGLVIITCQKASSIQRQLLGIPQGICNPAGMVLPIV